MNKNLILALCTFCLFISWNGNIAYAQHASEGKIWESWERVADLPFSMRDGVGAVHFKDEIWMIGGWKYGPLSNGIYKSADAVHWEKVGNGSWPGRHGGGVVVFKDKIWVLSGDGYPDVWSSADGITWNQETASAPWGMRYAPYVVAYHDKLWIMGGVSFWDAEGNYDHTLERPLNDIWSSEDGVNWTLEMPSAPWGPRGLMHGSVVFKDEMWVFGGGSKLWNIPTNVFNDVWKSKDGVNWELVTDHAGWDPRIHFSVIAFDNKLWAIDGTTMAEAYTNEVWYSEDGKDWTRLNSTTTFEATHASTVYAHKNSLYLAAGSNITGIYKFTTPAEQQLAAHPLPAVRYEPDTLQLDFGLSSGLQPTYSVLDTTVAEILPGNRLVAKKVGETQVVVSHPGSYGFFPLDPVYFDFNVLKKTQTINVQEFATEALISDTVRIDAMASSGLPVKIVPNPSIIITAENEFVIKNPGLVIVELVQEGDKNFDAATKAMEFFVAHPKGYTLFPNPAGDFVRIIVEENAQVEHFTITSLTGKKVKAFSAFGENSSFYTLELDDLPSGIYVLTVFEKNKRTSLKFVKRS
ncbi:T9SS type A sorting domain-containing protein [Pontibacter sp. E15-1]|uniref:T9SS C-terminal target domain-containing protein n=1 Tax=Pontibacter sp. E15-1 TaxID=2919918 RepID=UPI001F4FE068|nr:T9SS C-terminal target domain-containing protein [Pontibacter sp. E15-1]MCJ8165327.1 T9SS type A sorting domain-containing protein [Pontibacter sp. E15-1]